jgi:large conductance mechanosensitive channel
MLKEFKQFLLRGNVIDLAVGVVIGAAFGAVVTALVTDLITPLISAIAKSPDFSAFSFSVHGSKILVGNFINSVVSFVLIAAGVFFLIVKPTNLLIRKAHKEPPTDPTTKKCPECLSEIPIDAKRCAHCAQLVA